ncbi:hypothetical protein SVA_0217 [Sulfurifustis variabilis]|uniref:Uncharacterized protein n=1 Tax=Sulfurifustis variabilis TaxID=1675686 RepID=A0A1B4V049_9GAMM|nr:hypothetical protein SVA_0217 [Sulfurifustis variabilis]
MTRNPEKIDPIERKLDSILSVLQDLLILQGAKAGIKRDDLRRIVSVDTNRVSRVMKHVRRAKNEVE